MKGLGQMDVRAATAEVVTAGVTADVTAGGEGFVSILYRLSQAGSRATEGCR